MTRRYNPQQEREDAQHLIKLAFNYKKYGTCYPTEEQIKKATEAEAETKQQPDTEA